MENLHIPITGDNQGFVKALNDARDKVRSTAREIERSGMSIEDMFGRIKQAAALSLAGFSAKEFIQKVVQVRGEFQQLEVAFKTMLGSAEKADALLQQLTNTAAKTPFDLQGVTNGAKQLLAYGIAAEDVNSTLIHLGDIAAGLSLPLTDLVYLYGTTMVQGRMFTQDLRQFQNRGIPIAEELGKVLGVTKDKVGELVTAGKVGAKEFNQAIMAMSSEGGKFGGLMEAKSKTITGQISNIEDAIDVMFNNIGKQSEGIINDTLSVVSSLVENYERVGKAIASAIAVYGTYKAAVMAVCAAHKVHTAWLALEQTAHIQNALATNVEIAAKGRATAATVLLDKAQKMLNATMLANPYVLVAAAIATVAAALWNMKSKQEMVQEAIEKYNKEKDEAIRKEEEHASKVRELAGIVENETLSMDNRRDALIRLEQQYPSVFEKYKTEAEMLEHIRDIMNEIAILDGRKSIKDPKNELSRINSRIAELQGKVGTVSTYNTSAGSYTVTSGGRTKEEDAELDALKKTREHLKRKIKKEDANNYLKDLTGISNEELQRQIETRNNLLAKMKLEQKKYGEVKTGGATGVFTENELQAQLQAFEREQNRRKEKKITPSQQKKALRESWEKAKKALAEFDKSSNKYTAAEAETARKKLEEAVQDAEKKYKDFGGSVSADKAAAKKLKEQEKANARYKELQDKQKIDAERAAKDMELSTEQARIDAMDEGAEKTVRQIEHDFEVQYEEIMRGYDDLKKKKIEEARKLWESNPANENKLFDASSVDVSYTKEENENLARQLEANEAKRKESLHKLQVEEANYQIEYLKNYGTFQEQKGAITEEYNEKIAQAENEWQKRSLEEQKKEALSKLEMTRIKFNIDWGSVFGNLANKSISELERIKKELEILSGSGDITDIEQIKELQGAISDLREELASRRGGFVALRDSFKDLKTATNDLNKAENNLLKARADGNAEAERAAEKELELARDRKKSAEKAVEAAKKATANILNSFANLDFTSFGGVFRGLRDLAPSIDNVFKTNISGIFQELGDEMTDAIASFGDSIVSLSQNVASLFRSSKDEDTYMKQQLAMFDSLSESINNLAEVIEKGSVKEGLDAYEKQLEDLEKQLTIGQSNLQETMYEYYHGSGTGWAAAKDGRSYDSIDRLIDKQLFDWSDWKAISDLLGKDVYQASELWSLTPEELKMIQANLGVTFGKIFQAFEKQAGQGKNDSSGGGKTASANAQKALEDYMSLAGRAEELSNIISARITQITFDDLKSNFMSTLKDMEKSASDFGEDVAEIFSEALFNMEFDKDDGLKHELGIWYRDLKTLLTMRLNGEISEEDFEANVKGMKGRYQDLSERGRELQELANKIAGVNPEKYEQEASVKGFQAMGQDTADELNGRFTALQITGEKISENIVAALEALTSMSGLADERNTTLSEIRNLMLTNNEHLEDVVMYSKKVYDEFGEKLDKIATNTKRI